MQSWLSQVIAALSVLIREGVRDGFSQLHLSVYCFQWSLGQCRSNQSLLWELRWERSKEIQEPHKNSLNFRVVHTDDTAGPCDSLPTRIQLAGCESHRLVCSSLSFQIPFLFSISKAQAHPHNQLLSGWLPRCDIYRVYWKLLAHYWASKCDCFSKKEISWSVGLVASLDCKQREPEVRTKLHCFFYLQKQFAALCFLSDP